MCGRFTRMYTWPELVALYRLTDPAPPSNLQPRYNICPTQTIDAVIERGRKRVLEQVRWGLGADSEEKHEPASDIDTAVVDGLKVLDPDRPIREADISTSRPQP